MCRPIVTKLAVIVMFALVAPLALQWAPVLQAWGFDIAYGQDDFDLGDDFGEETPPEGEGSAASERLTAWGIIKAGGSIEFIIILCSVVGVGLIIEHFISIKESKLLAPGLAKNVAELLSQGDVANANKFCDADKSMLGLILRNGLRRLSKGEDAVKEAILDAGSRCAADLEQKISYLNFIGTIAPMLGLLGTVLGMIDAFNTIAFEEGLGKPGLLALGVSKALVTTATGLIVAIPVMGFWFYFRGKVRRIMVRAEEECFDVMYAASHVSDPNPPSTPKAAE